MSPFVNVFPISFSLSQCLRSSHPVLSLWRQLSHSQSFSWLLLVFSVYTRFFSLNFLSLLCSSLSHTACARNSTSVFIPLSGLGDRYSNRRVQESTLMEQHKVHLTQHVQVVRYLAFEDQYSTPRVQTPVLVYVNRPHLIMEHVHIGWPATTDEPQFKTKLEENNKRDKPKHNQLKGSMATNHNSYCNTEIVADQPQLVSFLAKNPAKKPENACGLPSSSLTPLAEEVQGPPAGGVVPQNTKKLYSRIVFWGSQNTNFLASRNVF